MRELELDGIHDDGEHLILVDSDGERYTLRIGEALRAAVRRDRPALGMIRAAEAGALRPKDIQAMLRSGRSAEDISEMSQIPLDHVRRYEGPVLAEREWTAQRARTFHVGRGGPALEQMVAERLAARHASPDTVWDAWRRSDGTWALELTFSAAGRTRQAHWVVDLDNRTVTAKDDEARWISDEDADPEPTRGRARLVSVKSSVYDLEADGSFDEGAGRPRRRTPMSSEHPAAIDESELDALNARRGLRSVPQPGTDSADHDDRDPAGADPESMGVWSSLEDDAPEEGEHRTDDSADADQDDPDQEAWIEHTREVPDEQADMGGTAEDTEDLEEPAEGTDGTEDREQVEQDELQDPDAGAPEAEQAPIEYQDTVDLTPLPGLEAASEDNSPAEDSPKPAPKKAGKSRSKRASMPSWDEIVFGSKHD